MTDRQIVALAVRMLALWLVLNAFQIIASVLSLLTYFTKGSWISLLTACIYIGMAIFLWKRPLQFAAKVLPDDVSGTKFPPTLVDRQMVCVASIVIGLVLIAFKALVPITQYALLLSLMFSNKQDNLMGALSNHADGIVGIVVLIAGLLFIFKAQALANWLMPKV